MMRKIKFRVVYKNEIQNLSFPDDFVIDTNGDLISHESYVSNTDYYTQQYTGINDIHGNEIYEGDFVKSKIFVRDDDEQSITGKVVFIKGAFGVECYENEVPVEFIYICEFEYLEIIK
jgi:hypothetical protein